MPMGTETGIRGSMFESNPVCIFTNSQYPAETFDFLTYYTTNDAQVRNYEVMSAPLVRPDIIASDTLHSSALMRVFGGIMNEAPSRTARQFPGTRVLQDHQRNVADWLVRAKMLDEVIGSVQTAAAEILAKPSLEA